MKPKFFLWLALVLSGALFGCSTSHDQLSNLPARYHNAQYGLTFDLPGDWRGYSVLMSQWDGKKYSPGKDTEVVAALGPIIILRNPQWKTNYLYQDIPLYVFTRRQWDDIDLGKFSAPVGAGGVIYELWHNDKYVFGIHSRYNANDSVPGWKEVDAIVNQNCVAHPEPHLHDQ
ncbi:MAG TPA: hypothetical protein VGI03_02915 [Verrucomicrobiae bacterium]